MYKPTFSHIYIEEDSLDDRLTSEIQKRFKKANIIHIKHYKDLFNKKNQSIDIQKKSPKLILARKKRPFIYEGSDLIQSFGYDKYLYAPIVQNCIYDCSYCILQGMYESGNIVIFTNIDDYFTEAKDVLKDQKLHLSISYDTDLLALEKIHKLSARWIEFIRDFPSVEMELRTKSANFSTISHIEAVQNVILSWSLSPEVIISKHDISTPRLSARIKDIKNALSLGWKVRICIDPLIYLKDFERIYDEFILKLHNEIDFGKIHSIALGAFRINSNYLKKIQKQKRDRDILYYPYENKNGVSRYEETLETNMLNFVKKLLLKYIKEEKIFIA